MKLLLSSALLSFILLNCGGTSQHGKYMHNRSIEQQIADEEREKVVKEEYSKKRMQGTVDQKMEEFNRKAIEKKSD